MSQICLSDELKQKISASSNWDRYQDEILAAAKYSSRKAYELTIALRREQKLTRSQILSGLDAYIETNCRSRSALANKVIELRNTISQERSGLLTRIKHLEHTQIHQIASLLREGKANEYLSPKDIQTLTINCIYFALKELRPEDIAVLFRDLINSAVYSRTGIAKLSANIDHYREVVIRDLCKSQAFQPAKSLAQLTYQSEFFALSPSDTSYERVVKLEKELLDRQAAQAERERRIREAYLRRQAEEERRQAVIAAEEEKRRQEYAQKCLAVEQPLRQFDFCAADQLSDMIQPEDFLKLKTKYAQQWFAEAVTHDGAPYVMDEEQIRAVIDSHDHTIVAARAGSGKTRTIVAKIIFLVAKYHLTPDELLVFVFNRDAANEINLRLERIYVNGRQLITNVTVATTFHAFARQIVYEICHEQEKYGQILVAERPYFIQAITEEVPREQVYKFFRNECFQIKRDQFGSEADYYEALRNSSYETLKGEVVKSQAEKIIADFLFEHGINYYYEKEYYPLQVYPICQASSRSRLWELKNTFQQESIKPDFYLVDYDIPWEHWAISGRESFAERQEIDSSQVVGNYDDYYEKMLWKQWFYSREWLNPDAQTSNKYALQFLRFRPLIETYKSADASREDFERQIEAILTAHGVKCEKRPLDELINEVWDSQIKRFSKMVSQFIDRAEQQFFDNSEVLKFKVSSFNGDSRVQSFLKIAYQCYENYLACLSEKTHPGRHDQSFNQYGIDFSLLITRAIDLVKAANDDITYLLSNKKYILIDEYQDFSRLFLEMVRAIRQVATQAKLFVVGDDWQAINRFAGSDVDYFQNFDHYFSGETRHLEISTNYRCDRNIVNNASAFVENAMGDSGRYVAASKRDGLACVLLANEINVDYTAENADEIFKRNMQISAAGNCSKISVQYLKLVTAIIQKNVSCDNILILHRNNDTSFWFISLEEFYKRLRKTVVELHIMTSEEFDRKVSIKTMHRAKGLEADTVIILEADDGIIPSYHQDTSLYEIFGETPSIALEDQKRLFYVAITRAKRRLYILHNQSNSDQEDGFIQYLDSRFLSSAGKAGKS